MWRREVTLLLEVCMVHPVTDDLIAFLNEIVAIDPLAIAALVGHRVPCNEALANHPAVPVSLFDDVNRVGVLGVLNGFCGSIEDGPCAGWGPIAARFDRNDRLTGFLRTEQAVIVGPPSKD
jgi:hypothetical protein